MRQKQMNSKISVVILGMIIFIGMFAMSGCKPKNDIVGVWESVDIPNTTATFTHEGEYIFRGFMGIDADGTYELDGDQLTITVPGEYTSAEKISFSDDGDMMTLSHSGKKFTYVRLK
jgi:hypothetical protein